MSRLALSHAFSDGPQFGGNNRPWSVAQLLAINSTTNRAQVSVDGGPAVWLPFCGAVAIYSGITTVNVLRDPLGSGSGQLVLGPNGTQVTPPAAPPAQAPTSVQKTVVIRPSDSGTWSAKWGRFYAWNVGRYGGSTTLYQASFGVSGALSGIAVYGNQLKALGASSIDAITLHVPLATGSGTVQVQETSQGSLSGAPSPSGATASGTGTIALGSTIRNNLRTGATKGLVLVGVAYLAVKGKASANGMAMTVTYTRTT
jgi:hypothetical protein